MKYDNSKKTIKNQVSLFPFQFLHQKSDLFTFKSLNLFSMDFDYDTQFQIYR